MHQPYSVLTTIMQPNVLAALLSCSVLAYALPPEDRIQARDAAVDNLVSVTDSNTFWYALILYLCRPTLISYRLTV